MRHVFLINPAAGKYDRTGEFTQTIRAACEGLDYEILVSRAPGDCTHIAQAAASSGEPVRLYACGGDGTLNEVVNGAAGHANAAVTHFPGGSGNDFIKIFLRSGGLPLPAPPARRRGGHIRPHPLQRAELRRQHLLHGLRCPHRNGNRAL